MRKSLLFSMLVTSTGIVGIFYLCGREISLPASPHIAPFESKLELGAFPIPEPKQDSSAVRTQDAKTAPETTHAHPAQLEKTGPAPRGQQEAQLGASLYSFFLDRASATTSSNLHDRLAELTSKLNLKVEQQAALAQYYDSLGQRILKLVLDPYGKFSPAELSESSVMERVLSNEQLVKYHEQTRLSAAGDRDDTELDLPEELDETDGSILEGAIHSSNQVYREELTQFIAQIHEPGAQVSLVDILSEVARLEQNRRNALSNLAQTILPSEQAAYITTQLSSDGRRVAESMAEFLGDQAPGEGPDGI